MALVRKCEQCGHLEARVSWRSEEEAATEPRFDAWTCPMCAWTGSELVEAEAEPARP